MDKVQLIAPWYVFVDKVKYTYGLSNFINVKDLAISDNGYVLNIFVTSNSIAKALRAVLPDIKEFGNVQVNIVIYNAQNEVVPVSNMVYTPESLARTFCIALYSNPLFIGTIITSDIKKDTIDLLGDVVVLIKPEIIQFNDGSLNHLCGIVSEVAAEVFTEVSNLSYPNNLKVSFNSYSKKCDLENYIFCSYKPCLDGNEIWNKCYRFNNECNFGTSFNCTCFYTVK